MRTSLLKHESYARTPWKNGLGWTEQIAIDPPGADLRRADFLWRLSSAHIAGSAPFSPFPEHDRVLVVLEGEGVRLTHQIEEGEAPEVVDLPPLEPYEFPGDIPTRCELLGGPIRDLSVFMRKGEVSVETEAVAVSSGEPFEWAPRGRIAFLFVARGAVSVRETGLGGGTRELGALDSLRVELDGPDETPLEVLAAGGEARLVLVSIA